VIDRFLTGHFIGPLTDAYYNLTANGEFSRINELIDNIGAYLHVGFPIEEKIFAFLPIAGMRTPADLGSVKEMELDETIYPLSKKIMAQIREELDIAINPRDFAQEFAYHLMFMMNRLRFKIRQPNSMLEELKHKLEKVRYWDQVEMPILDDNQYILSSLLDEDRVFFFEKGRSYIDALNEMIEILTDEGQIDEGFGERLFEREEKGTMVFDNGVAIPHGIQKSNDRMLLAVGIFEEATEHKGHPVRIIFFMALPEQSDADDMLMIRVYDELLEISRDTDMLDAIVRTQTWPELMRVLYKKA
jgi:lichenan operon transcriptional antiterminator